MNKIVLILFALLTFSASANSQALQTSQTSMMPFYHVFNCVEPKIMADDSGFTVEINYGPNGNFSILNFLTMQQKQFVSSTAVREYTSPTKVTYVGRDFKLQIVQLPNSDPNDPNSRLVGRLRTLLPNNEHLDVKMICHRLR